MSEQLTFIDLFAGVGGFRRGMELAGHKCVGFCEWDKYAAMSYTSMHLATYEQIEKLKSIDKLKDRQKEIQKEEYRNGEWYSNDIRAVDADSVPHADVWCFGAPCQDFSIAGNRAGLDGDRSSLVREVFRIIEEFKEEDRPEWLIYENVKGMLSSNNGWDFACILVEMESLGYDIEYQLFNSKDFGVPQNRERVYTVGHLRRYGRRKILPIRGNNTEIGITEELKIKENRHSSLMNSVLNTQGISPALDCMQGGNRQPKVLLMGNVNPSGSGMNGNIFNSKGISPTLTTNKGEGIKVACGNYERPDYKSRYALQKESISPTLNARDYKSPVQVAIPVLTPDRLEKRQNGRRFKEDGEPMFTLTAQDRHGVAIIDDMYINREPRVYEDTCPTLRSDRQGLKVREATKQGYAIATEGDSINLEQPNSKTRRGRVGVGVAQTLTTSCNQATLTNKMRIRKLTPRECFRLQGWTEDYFERAALVNSDSQLYKQAGNGVTVNVVHAIADKLTKGSVTHE